MQYSILFTALLALGAVAAPMSMSHSQGKFIYTSVTIIYSYIQIQLPRETPLKMLLPIPTLINAMLQKRLSLTQTHINVMLQKKLLLTQTLINVMLPKMLLRTQTLINVMLPKMLSRTRTRIKKNKPPERDCDQERVSGERKRDASVFARS